MVVQRIATNPCRCGEPVVEVSNLEFRDLVGTWLSTPSSAARSSECSAPTARRRVSRRLREDPEREDVDQPGKSGEGQAQAWPSAFPMPPAIQENNQRVTWQVSFARWFVAASLALCFSDATGDPGKQSARHMVGLLWKMVCGYFIGSPLGNAIFFPI